MTNLDVMPDASEIVHYDRPDIPLYIRIGTLSHYPDHKALCHWHEDFEFIRIYDGEMDYFIGGKNIRMKAGDCLFVNSRQMHYGYSPQKKECHFLCVLISPAILTGSRQLFDENIAPLMKNGNFPFIHITKEDEEITTFQHLLDKTYHLKENNSNYEIYAMSALLELVLNLIEREPAAEDFKSESSLLVTHRKMVAYISSHFDDEISLNDIAGSASVSRATCCRIFRKIDQLSPIEFLTIYRLNVSADLLTRTDESISLIAGKCGFNSVSYYSKLFLEHYGCQPHKYRNLAIISSENTSEHPL